MRQGWSSLSAGDKVRVGLLAVAVLALGVLIINQFGVVNPKVDEQITGLQDVQDALLATQRAGHEAALNNCHLNNQHLVAPVDRAIGAVRAEADASHHSAIARGVNKVPFSRCKRKYPFGHAPRPPYFRPAAEPGEPGGARLVAESFAMQQLAAKRRHSCRWYRRHHRRLPRRCRHRHHRRHHPTCVIVIVNGVKVCIPPVGAGERRR